MDVCSASSKIQLTRGYSALVDPEDFERFEDLPWFALKTRHGVYAGYKPNRSTKTFLLHRMIMDAKDGFQVDHIDRNTLDCRRANLRCCTPAQNSWNKRPNKPNSTGFHGVIKTKEGYFIGRIDANRKRHHTPTFNCPATAALYRDILAQRLHGEFAVLNFQFQPVSVAVQPMPNFQLPLFVA